MKGRIAIFAFVACAATTLCGFAADGSWLKHVPAKYASKHSPIAAQQEDIAAGRQLFMQHRAACHGGDARGRGSHPGLRSERVRLATDGELYWLLENGNLAHGMPSWSRLPEEQRWQLVAYLHSPAVSSQTE